MGMEGIGARVVRKEDKRFLTGKGRYTDDMVVPGMKFAAFVRSPHAHAKINGIDIEAARAMPGVIDVLEGRQLQADGIGNLICGWMIHSKDGTPMKMGAWRPLAIDTVRYVGDAVAIVVADSAGEARDAAEAVVVDYEELPAVTSAVAALQPGAPQIHPEAPGNLIFDWQIGDPAATDAAIAAAAHVTEIEILNNRLSPNPMEPRATLGIYDAAEDHFTCYTTSQNPHVARLVMSAFYNVAPENKLRVIAPDVGGGFGSKIYIYPEEIVCLWASKKTGVPVKWTSDRTEAFLTDAHGRDHVSKVKMAFDKDHRIIGLKVDTIANLGAYMSLLVGGADLSLCDASVWPICHSGDPRQCAHGVHDHRSRRCLSRGRAAGSDLSSGTHHGSGRARTWPVAGRTSAQELHPQLPLPDACHHDL
jgi:aerobic carbon-monoxide dehydrogenase large subunit